MSLLNLWKPEAFQGRLESRRYFEGWYFRLTSADARDALVFIPGVSLAPNPADSHCFIQYIDGRRGKSGYIRYPLGEFRPEGRRLDVRVGPSRFRLDGIELDVEDGGFSARGTLAFSAVQGWPVRLLAPGCMGPYRFAPRMECLHGILSLDHEIAGSLAVNGETVSFDSGRGYIEKDWGRSMPRAWVWLQCNSFAGRRACVTVSIADVPWLGSSFAGFIAGLWLDGRLFEFTTWNRSRLVALRLEGRLRIRVANRRYALEIEAAAPRGAELASPRHGAMTGRIRETLDAEVNVRLERFDGAVLFDDTGRRAGLEIVGDVAALVPR